jgi:hypothetical protein
MIDAIDTQCGAVAPVYGTYPGVYPGYFQGVFPAGQTKAGHGGGGGGGGGGFRGDGFRGGFFPGFFPGVFPAFAPPPYPLTTSYWFSKLSLAPGAWCAMGYYDKLNAVSAVLSSQGQILNQVVINALINDLDSYCQSALYTQSFLSPYVYQNPPYGFGSTIPFAFPFIFGRSFFRTPSGGIQPPAMGGSGGGGGKR